MYRDEIHYYILLFRLPSRSGLIRNECLNMYVCVFAMNLGSFSPISDWEP